jgi:hypothetical protein
MITFFAMYYLIRFLAVNLWKAFCFFLFLVLSSSD